MKFPGGTLFLWGSIILIMKLTSKGTFTTHRVWRENALLL